MKIAALEAQAKAQFNITAGTEENIEELNKRLFDLRDKAKTEISMKALDNIQRLRAQNLETLQVSMSLMIIVTRQLEWEGNDRSVWVAR